MWKNLTFANLEIALIRADVSRWSLEIDLVKFTRDVILLSSVAYSLSGDNSVVRN
jgi:hypothetical protein